MAATRKISIVDALAELLQALSTRTDLLSILRLIMDLAVRLSNADRASIFLLDKSRDEVWTIMADGDQVIRLPRGAGIVGEVIGRNLSLNIPDTSNDERFYPGTDMKTGYVTRTILCVPLRNRNGESSGAVEVLNKRRGTFTDSDQQILEMLGIQAGLAIESVEMYEDIQESCRQLQLLLETQKHINVSLESEQMFRVVLEDLIPAVGGACGIICTVSRGGDATFHGYHPEHGERSWEEDDRRSWPGYLLSLHDRLDQVPNHHRHEFRHETGLVYAPLRKEDRNLGFIAVLLNETPNRLFNDRSFDYVRVIAEQTIAFLDKSELLEQKRRDEKQALLGTMLSTIVHDMKSPLSGISGFAQLIRRRTSDERIIEYCATILDTLSRLERTNSELLLFVRGQSVALDKKTFAVRDLLQDVAALFQERARDAGMDLSVVCHGDIAICADRDRLMRAITNLVSNGYEALFERGEIRIESRQEGHEIVIRVVDTGRGIPVHLRESMFEPFVTQGKKNGTGLGMSIVKTIIDLHKGTIGVQSVLGKGTTITVRLPMNV